MKIGVALSAYNKIDEIATNVNIIRKHWPVKGTFISVCSNDPNSISYLETLDVNKVTLGEDYPIQPKSWKRLRQHDTIKKAISGCIDNADYVVQWHGDAYALDQSSILDIIDKMDTYGYRVAFRGKWTREFNLKRPVGHVDDHFSFYSCAHLQKTGMFSDDKLEMLKVLSQDNGDKVKYLTPWQIEHIKKRASVTDKGLPYVIANQWSSEGLLCHLIQSLTTEDQRFYYDDLGNNIIDQDVITFVDDFYPDKISHSSIPPLNFDPVRKFLHSDKWEHTRRIFGECGVPLDLISVRNT